MLKDTVIKYHLEGTIVWDEDTQQHWILTHYEDSDEREKPYWIDTGGGIGKPLNALVNFRQPRFDFISHHLLIDSFSTKFAYLSDGHIIATWSQMSRVWTYEFSDGVDGVEELDEMEYTGDAPWPVPSYLSDEEKESLTAGWQE